MNPDLRVNFVPRPPAPAERLARPERNTRVQALEAAILGHEQANRSYFEQMENFLEAARSAYRVVVAGNPEKKRQVVQL